VRVTPADGQDGQDWSRFGEVAEDGGDGTGAGASAGTSVVLRVPRAEVPRVVGELLARTPVAGLAVEEPPLDAVLARFYQRATS
jgi:hypothetical protein